MCSFTNKAESVLQISTRGVIFTTWLPRCRERRVIIPCFQRLLETKASTVAVSHKRESTRKSLSMFAETPSSSKLNDIALRKYDGDYLPLFDPVVYAEETIGHPWEHSIQGKDFPTIFQPLMDWILTYTAQNLNNLSPITTIDRDMMFHYGGAAYISSSKQTQQLKNVSSSALSSISQEEGILDDDRKVFGTNKWGGERQPSIRMGTLVFESKKFRRIRITHYDGGATQVFNSLWYPHAHIDAPLLGINMVSFGEQDRRQLCIIDFQPLDVQHKQLASPLQHIKDTHPSLNGTLSTRFYDGKYFSPYMILGKFGNSQDMKDVAFPAMKLAIEEYIQMVDRQKVENLDSLTTDDRQKRQDEYNRYNAKVDPSLGIYEAQFGRDWARDYISNVKFS